MRQQDELWDEQQRPFLILRRDENHFSISIILFKQQNICTYIHWISLLLLPSPPPFSTSHHLPPPPPPPPPQTSSFFSTSSHPLLLPPYLLHYIFTLCLLYPHCNLLRGFIRPDLTLLGFSLRTYLILYVSLEIVRPEK